MCALMSSIHILGEIFIELKQEKNKSNIFVASLIFLISKLNVHERMLGNG